MTAITASQRAAGTRRFRPPLVTYPLLLRFATQLGSSVSFCLLLSVVPLYARTAAGGSAAGLATGVPMVATVAGGTGYPAAFAITSAAMLAALAPALRDRRLAAR